MALVNLTPHALNIYTDAGQIELPPSGQLARVRSHSAPCPPADGIPMVRPTFTEVEGLPDPQPGTYYVVSGLIQSALRAQGVDRPDVLAPGTGPNDGAVRCPHTNQVRGVTRLLAL